MPKATDFSYSAHLRGLINDELNGRSEHQLAETDWRTYRRIRELRLDLAKALVYERHSTDAHTVDLVRTFNDPKARKAVADFKKRVDLDEVLSELQAAITAVQKEQLSICNGCNRVFLLSDLVRIQVETFSHRCLTCAEEIWNQPNDPPITGIRSALARARKYKLQATLTEEEWRQTLKHLKDRCAYCNLAWCLVEHATPVERGGPTTRDNCLPACQSCNKRKGSRTIEEYLLVPRINSKRITYALDWLRHNGRAAG